MTPDRAVYCLVVTLSPTSLQNNLRQRQRPLSATPPFLQHRKIPPLTLSDDTNNDIIANASFFSNDNVETGFDRDAAFDETPKFAPTKQPTLAHNSPRLPSPRLA